MNKQSRAAMDTSIPYLVILLAILASVIAQNIAPEIEIVLPAEDSAIGNTSTGTEENATIEQPAENQTIEPPTENASVLRASEENISPEVPAEPPMEAPVQEKRKVKFQEDGKQLTIELSEELEPYAVKLTAETAELLEQENEETEGEFMVAFYEDTDKEQREKALENIAEKKEIRNFKGAKLKAAVKDVKAILQDPKVKYVELDQDIALFDHKEGHKKVDEVPWGIQKVQSWVAWNETLGEKVKVAVLDSGVDFHRDVQIQGGTGIVGNGYRDTYGHGTQVAGIIAAEADGRGIVGNAPKAELYSVKITENGEGKLSDAIGGLQWAVDNNMDIASMSFGFPAYSQIFKEVVQRAYAQGMLLIAAAGNDGKGQILYPAKYADVVAVGAMTESEERAAFSNYGFDLELVAPGVGIKTTTLDGQYTEVEGTSYAVPHVAGVAALIMSQYPLLTNKQIRQKLRRDAKDIGSEGFDDFTGYGLVQFKFGAENLSDVNDSYYYEVYNITVEKGENVLTFWVEGYGSIDDVNFQEGEYFIKRNISGRIIEEMMEVDEEQMFRLLARSIELVDNFTRNGSTTTDGIVWKNGVLEGNIINPDDNDALVECWDWQDDGIWDDCFADTTTKFNKCKVDSLYLTNICEGKCSDEAPPGSCPQTDCDGGDNIFIGAFLGDHEIKKDEQAKLGQQEDDTEPITGEIIRDDVDVHYYYNCDGEGAIDKGAKIRGFGEPKYHVIDAKRALCIGPTTYRFDGRFDLNGPLFITFKNNVACPAETECDANLDDVLVFEKDGNMPNVCTALNATDMAILEVIPIQVIPDVDMVKDKSGYVVIVVENRGNVTGNASVNATFAGSPLVPLNGIYSANISPKKNASINFTFKPGTAGNNLEIIANVSVS